MPWPENLIYDFNLPPATTPSAAEEFISSLSTSNKNKEFLRLHYRDGQSYTDIAPPYGISAGGVRQAIKYVIGRYTSSSSAPIHSTDAESSVESASADSEIDVDTVASSALADISDTTESLVFPPKKIREELKPIITAIGTTSLKFQT